ncbi:MAG: hypothetical protein R3A52_29475 [Polyangiales bacterium]
MPYREPPERPEPRRVIVLTPRELAWVASLCAAAGALCAWALGAALSPG